MADSDYYDDEFEEDDFLRGGTPGSSAPTSHHRGSSRQDGVLDSGAAPHRTQDLHLNRLQGSFSGGKLSEGAGRSALGAAGAASIAGTDTGSMDKLRLANQLLRTQVRELTGALQAARRDRGTTAGSAADHESTAALERHRLLAALQGKDKALRAMTRKFESARAAAIKARKAAQSAAGGERAADLDNQRRALGRELEAVVAENRALKKMQRQLVRRMEEQDAATADMPARIAALQEEVRVATSRMKAYREDALRASAAADAHRDRLMRLQTAHRKLKRKKKGTSSTASTPRKKGSGAGGSTPSTAGGRTPSASPSASAVFKRSKAKWDAEKDELLKRIMSLERERVEARTRDPHDTMGAGNPAAEESQRLLRENVAELTRLKQAMAKQQKALEEKEAELAQRTAQLHEAHAAPVPAPASAPSPAKDDELGKSWAQSRHAPAAVPDEASDGDDGYSDDEYEQSSKSARQAPVPAPAPASDEYVPSFLRGSAPAPAPAPAAGGSGGDYKPSFMSSSPAPAPAPAAGGSGSDYKPSFMSSSPAPAPAPAAKEDEYLPSFLRSGPSTSAAQPSSTSGQQVTSGASGMPSWLMDDMESSMPAPAPAPVPAPAPAPAPAFGGGGFGGGSGDAFSRPSFTTKKHTMDWM